MLLTLMPGIVIADDEMSVDQAIKVLETSLNHDQRILALYALRVAQEKSAPAINVLARIIAQDPCGEEAGFAAEVMGYVGEPSIPLVAELIKNGFEWSYLFASRSYRFPHDLDEQILAELDPMLTSETSDKDRFNALLMIRWYPLETKTANELCNKLMIEKYKASWPALALFIAPKGSDPKILDRIQSLKLKSMQYIAARIREQWRRQPILLELSRPHVRKPLPADELARFNAADTKLTEMAKAAMPEALAKLGEARDKHEQYFWLAMVYYLADHYPPPQEEVYDVLDSVLRDRGSLIDRLLNEYKDELKIQAQQSRALQRRATGDR